MMIAPARKPRSEPHKIGKGRRSVKEGGWEFGTAVWSAGVPAGVPARSNLRRKKDACTSHVCRKEITTRANLRTLLRARTPNATRIWQAFLILPGPPDRFSPDVRRDIPAPAQGPFH